MPYKDLERKRQWEREHCEQRNAQRRQRRFTTQSESIAPKRVPDPVSAKETGSGWKIVLGFGVFLLALWTAMLGVNGFGSDLANPQ
jgi:hypothetical protein